jgi:hypothetical protein
MTQNGQASEGKRSLLKHRHGRSVPICIRLKFVAAILLL